MTFNLVIVESPAKCSKIQSFLGPGWKVLASMGHIRHLVDDLKALHMEEGFKPEYEFMKDKHKTILQLKDAAKEAKKVYLASDDDREGEAISYSVAVALHLNVKTNPRIVFHEITKQAVKNAIENPRIINMNRVNSQQARAVLDLMVGYMISPLLWKHVGKGLSAGRCQTPALRLIVERETQITDFKKKSMWNIKGSWTHRTINFAGRMIDTLEEEEDVLNHLENIHNEPIATIISLQTKPTNHNPPLPLITSSLQQEASSIYGLNPKATMRIAQTLYEAGHITYMRTDNVVMSDEAISDAQKQVETTYGKEYINTIIIKKVKKEPDAHEAIRPTHFDLVSLVDDYNHQEKSIYNLIYKRALQSVMVAAKGDERRIQWVIDNDPSEFSFEGVWKRTTFQGWKIVGQSESNLDEKEEEESQNWASSESLVLQEKIKWKQIIAEEKYTNPLPRYNEATLVRELEKKGIGRPSTFASLVETIVDKEYVVNKNEDTKDVKLLQYILEKPNVWPPKKIEEVKKVEGQKKKMFPTTLGKQVYTFCIKEFSQLFDYSFTKTMEDKLDLVEKGTEVWENVCKTTLDSYKTKYDELLKTKSSSEEEIIFGYHDDKPLVKKKGPYGEYILYDGKNIKLMENDTVEMIIERKEKKASANLHTLGEFVFREGPYGKYMMKNTSGGKKPLFVSIPSGLDVTKLTLEAAKKNI